MYERDYKVAPKSVYHQSRIYLNILFLSFGLALKMLFLQQTPASPWLHLIAISLYGIGLLASVLSFNKPVAITPGLNLNRSETQFSITDFFFDRLQLVIGISVAGFFMQWPPRIDLFYTAANILVLLNYYALYELSLAAFHNYFLLRGRDKID